MAEAFAISVSRIGDSASVQAVTRVNAEQASKRTLHGPTRYPMRGRLEGLGKRAMKRTQSPCRGSGDGMYDKGRTRATREAR